MYNFGKQLAFWRQILSATLLVALCAACGNRVVKSTALSTSEKNTTAYTPWQAHSPEALREHNQFFFEALRQKHKGNADAAYELLTRALEIAPGAPAACYEKGKLILLNSQSPYMEVMADSQLVEEGDSLLQLAYEGDKDNYDYLEILATRLHDKGKYSAAEPLYERMLGQRPKSETMVALMEIYKAQQKNEAALRMLDRVEENEGSNAAIARERVELYLAQGQKTKALHYIDSLCQLYRHEPMQRLSYATKYELLLDKDSVCAVYEDLLREYPDFEEAQSQLVFAYLTAEKQEQFRTALFELVKNPEHNPHKKSIFLIYLGKMAIGGLLERSLCYDAIYQASETHPKDTELAELLPMYAQQAECKGDTLEMALQRLLRLTPENDAVRRSLLLNEIKRDNTQGVADLCADGILYYPQSAVYYHYLGLAKLMMEGHDAAAKVWQLGVKQTSVHPKDSLPDDAQIISELHSSLGDWHHLHHRKAQSYAAYEKALHYNPANALCLNNYAYYLSLEKRQLKKALEMAEKAIEIDGDNPTIVDTYAWILYEVKRYAEAREQMVHCLKMSVELEEKGEKEISATLLEHAAEIYAKLGQRSTALVFRQFQQQAEKEQLDTTALKQLLDSL